MPFPFVLSFFRGILMLTICVSPLLSACRLPAGLSGRGQTVPGHEKPNPPPSAGEPAPLDCFMLQQRRILFLTGMDEPDTAFAADDAVRRFVEKQDQAAESVLQYFGGYDGISRYTFGGLPPEGKGIEEIYADCNRMLTLAKVYRTGKSRFFGKPELAAAINTLLKSLHETVYKTGNPEHTNWWHWEIGFPLKILDTLILLGSDAEPALRDNLIAATRYFQPDARYSGNNPGAIHPSGNPKRLSTGANRVDLVKLCVLRGILAGDVQEIKTAYTALPEVWAARTGTESGEARDGFYADGSFIQHGDIPYTGTYGAVLLGGIGEVLYLTGGSAAIPVPDGDNLYTHVFAAFEPLLYKGLMPDFVSGRAISRKNSFDRVNGQAVLNALSVLAKTAPEPYSQRIAALIKREWLNGGEAAAAGDGAASLFYLAAQAYQAAAAVEPLPYLPHLHCFNAMERYFFRSQKYAIALALHSKQIGNYETMNGENTKGWYTGDGMVYIYDRADNYRFFWHEADLHYIPGTTEVRQVMDGINAQRNGQNVSQGAPSSGSAETKIVRMDFHNWNNTLTSSKTWTFIPDGLYYSETITDVDAAADGTSSEVYHVLEHKQVFNSGSIRINGNPFGFTEGTHFIASLKECSVDGRCYTLDVPRPAQIRCYRKNGRAYCIITIELGTHPTNQTVAWTLSIV